MGWSGRVLLGAILAVLAACADLDALQMRIEKVIVLKPGQWGEQALVAIVVGFHNKGKEPVHVPYTSIHAINEQNERRNMVAFRKDLELRLKAAMQVRNAEMAWNTLARVGLDPEALQDLKTQVLEIPPGQTTKKVYPFGFDKPPRSVALEVLYHDDATDKMFKLRDEREVNDVSAAM